MLRITKINNGFQLSESNLQQSVVTSLDGFYTNEIKLKYVLCKDSTCQEKISFMGFDILNMNYMKIYLTNPLL